MTKENKEFLSEVLHDRHGLPTIVNGVYTYPKSVIGENENSLLKMKQIEPKEFNSKSRRCGLLARKIGVVPLWKKNGTRILTTMLQVDDNHVIRYIPPEEYVARQRQETWKENGKFACLLVGASSCDPSLFTKAYCGLFAKSGVLPKRHLSRFNITPDAELLPGTPLNVNHFKVGDYVDVRGTTSVSIVFSPQITNLFSSIVFSLQCLSWLSRSNETMGLQRYAGNSRCHKNTSSSWMHRLWSRSGTCAARTENAWNYGRLLKNSPWFEDLANQYKIQCHVGERSSSSGRNKYSSSNLRHDAVPKAPENFTSVSIMF